MEGIERVGLDRVNLWQLAQLTEYCELYARVVAACAGRSHGMLMTVLAEELADWAEINEYGSYVKVRLVETVWAMCVDVPNMFEKYRDLIEASYKAWRVSP